MSAAGWLSDPAKGIAKTVRPGQVLMAGVVEKVLEDKGFAMIEAGTGTGKSFGYLVPAILSGKRVVVSTAKKGLQKQLRDNDLPFLLSKLKAPAAFASIKGKNNYVCRLRLADFSDGDASARFSAADVIQFRSWVGDSGFGELDDYSKDIDFAHLVRVSECVGSKCDFAGECGYRAAKLKASTAKIVVVNHALLAFDLAMGGGKLFGAYDALIVDEAHQASKFFREAHTCRVHNKQPDAIRKLLSDTGLNVPETLEANVVRFLGKLPEKGRVHKNNAAVEAALDIYRDLLRLKQQFILEGVWSETVEMKEEEGNGGREAREVSRLRAATALTQRMLKACEVCVAKLDTRFDASGGEVLTPQDYVTYVETRIGRGEVHKEFVASPIEIGPMVAPALKRIGTAIFTSATLSTGGTFDYMMREFGLRDSEVEHKHVLPQPFNYKTHSCLFISSATTAYTRDAREQYWQSCANVMHDLFTASKGGAFVLCASYEDMTAFYDRLMVFRSPFYKMRTQSGNADALIAWFKSEPNGVAIGVKSIWEGVDIPGLGLRLVVIPRLPFPNPDDPVFTARKAKYIANTVAKGTEQRVAELNAWHHYDLQEAIIDFKQGAGRLVRRETDKGVVAVLDSRLFGNNKKYAGLVRNSIPHPPTYDIESTKTLLSVLSTRA